MGKFHVFGVPVTIGGVVPSPDDLTEEYKQIYHNKDAASIDRVLEIECTMQEEYNLVQASGRKWVVDDDEVEEDQRSLGGGFWSRLFG